MFAKTRAFFLSQRKVQRFWLFAVFESVVSKEKQRVKTFWLGAAAVAALFFHKRDAGIPLSFSLPRLSFPSGAAIQTTQAVSEQRPLVAEGHPTGRGAACTAEASCEKPGETPCNYNKPAKQALTRKWIHCYQCPEGINTNLPATRSCAHCADHFQKEQDVFPHR